MELTAGSVAGAGRSKVLRFPSLQHRLLLLGVVRPVLLHVIPDVPMQMIRVVPHESHLLQNRRHDAALPFLYALCKRTAD